ncbi:hypothetical protein XarbCFBP6827_18055 [Xanthomonas arboricola]|nr:hypothetical protein XarbCFBP6827_18055 [Xanthomonas arboricola]
MPLHEAPDVRMVQPLAIIQRESAAMLARLDTIKRRALDAYPITPNDGESCRVLSQNIITARHELLAIAGWQLKSPWYTRLLGSR